MIPFTVGSCDSISARTEFRRSSLSSRRFVPACTVGVSAVVDAPRESLVVEEAPLKMVDNGVRRGVLVLLLGAIGLTVADVAFIGRFYTLEGEVFDEIQFSLRTVF